MILANRIGDVGICFHECILTLLSQRWMELFHESQMMTKFIQGVSKTSEAFGGES